MTTLTRTIEILPAYEKCAEGYGVHGADMLFTLGNEKGYVTWCLFTNWYLPGVRNHDTVERDPFDYWHSPTPAGFAYHSPKQLSPEQSPSKCNLLGECYSDGTACTEDLFEILIAKGTDGIWTELESRWAGLFAEPQS